MQTGAFLKEQGALLEDAEEELLSALYNHVLIPEVVRQELSRPEGPEPVREWMLPSPSWITTREGSSENRRQRSQWGYCGASTDYLVGLPMSSSRPDLVATGWCSLRGPRGLPPQGEGPTRRPPRTRL